MRSIVREGQEFRQFSLSVADAKAFTKAIGEDYKYEMICDLEARGETTISFFANIGKFQNPAYASFAFLENPDSYCIDGADGRMVVSENQGKTNFDFRTSTFIDMCQ
jgi:hypothetical protein